MTSDTCRQRVGTCEAVPHHKYEVRELNNYANMYILLHEWEGSTGEYLVQGDPTTGRASTEAENRIFSCTAQPQECSDIFIT